MKQKLRQRKRRIARRLANRRGPERERPMLDADTIHYEIADRARSKTSIMPKGLLDKLTREEILDLIAYVYSRGDQKHAIFQGGGHEHGHGKGH